MQHEARWEDFLHMQPAFQATALFPWTPKEAGELQFAAGDVIDILDYEGEWWLGRVGEQIGEVPYNFLTYEGAEESQASVEQLAEDAPNYNHDVQPPEVIPQPPTQEEEEQQLQLQPQPQPQLGAKEPHPAVVPRAPSRPASGRPRSSRHVRAIAADDATLAPEVLQTLTHIVDERLLNELKVRDSMIESMKETVQQLETRLREQAREWASMRKHQHQMLAPMHSTPYLGLSSLSDSALTSRQPTRLRRYGSKIPVRRAYLSREHRNQLPPVSRALSDDLTQISGIDIGQEGCATDSTTDLAGTQLQSNGIGSLPHQTFRLEHVYGYHGARPAAGGSFASTNVKWLPSGEIIFPAAAVIVIYDPVSNTQRFFLGHDNEIAAISICPGSSIVASSETCVRESNAKICIYDTAVDDPVRGDSITLLHALAFPPVKGPALLDFSPDGELLVAFGQDEPHTVIVYDWKAETIVAETQTQNLDVYGAMCHPFQWRAATPYSPAMYTLLSCGSRHIRFWTITQDQSESPVTKRASPGRPKSKAAAKAWRIAQSTASLGKHADIRDITCLCCVKDSEGDTSLGLPGMGRIISGTSSGSLCVWTHVAEFSSFSGNLQEVGNEFLDEESELLHAQEQRQFLQWLPRGKLTSIIKDVHEGGVLDIAYLNTKHLLATTGKDGVVSVWKFEPSPTALGQKRNPLSLLFSSQISASAPAIGPARSIEWDPAGSALVLGTSGSAVCLLNMQTAEGGDAGNALALRVLLRGHSSKIRALTAHPTLPLLVSVSSDRTLRLWDSSTRRTASLTRLPDKCNAVVFAPDGTSVAVGTEDGEIFVLTTPLLSGEHVHTKDNKPQPPWEVTTRKTLRSKHHQAQSQVSMQTGEEISPNRRTRGSAPEITCLQYSPNGTYLAVGCRDNLIYILAADNHYKKAAICRGHTGTVMHLDFSGDGLWLRSCDQAREVLYWHVQNGKQMTNAQMKHADWATWTCFPAAASASNNSDVGVTCRSHDKSLLASSDRARIKLARFSCSDICEQREFRGHSSSVQDMTFSSTDEKFFSAGGVDTAILQWRVVDAQAN